jgi:hypothetical protein
MLNNIVCFVLIEWAFYKLKPLIPKNDADRERDAKYPCFSRGDLHRVHKPIFYLFGPFLFLRAFSAYGGIAMISLIVIIFSITHKRGEPYKGW